LGNTRLAKVDGDTGALYYYLNDRLGTPQYLTNDAGMVVWEATYKPFGEAEVHPNSRVENNFRFPGQYYDKETDLHYNYHRYYDPAIGRYLRPDPIGLAGGINLFTYVKNNPVGLIDPKGLIWVTIERDYSAAKNTGIGFLNWLARKIGSGWQGGIPMSHPSEWERMGRETMQEWQHDKNNPCEDSKHTIGAFRRAKQKYIKKPHI
jgi:RHS repeat-associated protein